jgi:flagellar basal-body rod protein FlgG
MSGGMYLAAAGALVQQMRLQLLANDVATINTVGYKGETSVFRVPEETQLAAGLPSAEGSQSLSPYAPPFSTMVDFSQGAIHQTGNPLDVALNGEGFFNVQTPDGIQYTRQGSFTLNTDGVLVTQDGHPVLGEGGQITIEGGNVEIDATGGVYADGDEVGRLQVTAFADNDSLAKTGNGRFVSKDPAAAGNRPENTGVRQGHLESANVNPVKAMTEMIETSRAFEAYQKVIQSADEATEKSINNVGKVA